jgi:hypothetical protein
VTCFGSSSSVQEKLNAAIPYHPECFQSLSMDVPRGQIVVVALLVEPPGMAERLQLLYELLRRSQVIQKRI